MKLYKIDCFPVLNIHLVISTLHSLTSLPLWICSYKVTALWYCFSASVRKWLLHRLLAALLQGCEVSLFDKRASARQFGFSRADLSSPTQVQSDYNHCLPLCRLSFHLRFRLHPYYHVFVLKRINSSYGSAWCSHYSGVLEQLTRRSLETLVLVWKLPGCPPVWTGRNRDAWKRRSQRWFN